MIEENEAPCADYRFEQGPIRPPSEAGSLLLRISRNCPWNRCTFCPVYKGTKFSLRPVEHVIQDIDAVKKQVERIKDLAGNGPLSGKLAALLRDQTESSELEAFYAAFNWVGNGMKSIFIQDANSLVLKPADLIKILEYLRESFPWVERITSYARSHTISKISDENLKTMAEAGLNRVHIGLESGSDRVLAMVKKGATKEMHVLAGVKVKSAGMELSEYVMPGLGGVEFSREHALESADALNRIDPDFIRLRTLALPNRSELFHAYNGGTFSKCTDRQVAEEILLFLETLDHISSTVKSDHILNLFQDLEGTLPHDKDKMTGIVRAFLAMDPESQMLYQVGRRLGHFASLGDMEDEKRVSRVWETCRTHGITPENADSVITEIMKRFI